MLHKGSRTTFSNSTFAWNTQNIFIQQTTYLVLQKTKFPVLKQIKYKAMNIRKKYWNQDMKQEENSIMS